MALHPVPHAISLFAATLYNSLALATLVARCLLDITTWGPRRHERTLRQGMVGG